MTSVFILTAEKIAELMFFFGIGFLFARRNLVPKNAPNTLSKILTMLFCPAMTLNGMIGNLTRAAFRANAKLLLVSAILMVAAMPVSRVLARRLSKGDGDLRAILNYNLLITNYGYIGNPLILSMFGNETLSRYLLFCIPISFVCYTYGRITLEGKGSLSPRFLLQPLTVSVWLGLLLGLLEVPVPRVVSDVLASAGNCTGPVAMLISGMILSRVNLKECFRNIRNYIFTALRLVILPLAAMAVMALLGIRGEAVFFVGVFMCLPFGSNPIVFREAVGLDTRVTVGMTMLSYLFSLVTVPVLFALFRSLAGLV